MRLRGKITLGMVLLILAAAVAAAPGMLSKFQKPGMDIPTVRVLRGPLENKVYAFGELRPVQTAMMVAPPVGGTLQIIHCVKTGSHVNKGDVIVEFDPSEQEFSLEQSRSQLEEADQQIKKMKADIAVRTAADVVALLQAQYSVRRAELQVKGNDLLGAIDARKNELSLEEAKRRLEQTQRDIKSRASSNQADLALQTVTRARAELTMKLAQQNIDNMILRAPIDGVVLLGQNIMALSSGGGIMISSGMDIPEFREGDTAYAGQTVAQIQNVKEMEILSKVAETDRGNLNPGQHIDVRVDALPLTNFSGKIKSLSGMASTSNQTITDMLASSKAFDASFALDSNGAILKPGISTRIVIRGANVNEVLSLPRPAVFTKEGKSIVYVKRSPEDWEARTINIKYLTESRAAIEGLAEGTEVALVDPNSVRGKAGGKSGPLGSILGGAAR